MRPKLSITKVKNGYIVALVCKGQGILAEPYSPKPIHVFGDHLKMLKFVAEFFEPGLNTSLESCAAKVEDKR